MSIDTDTIKLYPNEYFVETGTYKGDTVLKALKAGFKYIISIEVCDDLFQDAQNKFKEQSNVTIIHGDSSKMLFETVRDITLPITFWLDAHNPDFGKIKPKGATYAPILGELDQILLHPIKNHTILIDDMRVMKDMGVDIRDVHNKLKNINHRYNIETRNSITLNGIVYKNDILVAKLKEQ